jgi:hypothetical protein
MYSITLEDLERRIKFLNEITGNPTDKYEYGDFKVGNYHLYRACGKHYLHQVANKNGGTTDILHGGSKRDLCDRLNILIDGVILGKSLTEDDS